MSKRTREEQLALESQVKTERQKVVRRVRDITKRGYSLPKNFIPNLPQNITDATLRNFQKYTVEYVYKHAVYISPEGTKITGTKRRKQERSEAAKKGAETRRQRYYDSHPMSKKGTSKVLPKEENVVINNIQEQISMFTIEDIEYHINEWLIDDKWSRELTILKNRDVNLLSETLANAINEFDRATVAKNIQDNADEIMRIISSVLYESGSKYHDTGREGMNMKIQAFRRLITGQSLTARESLELTEYAEAVNEAQ